MEAPQTRFPKSGTVGGRQAGLIRKQRSVANPLRVNLYPSSQSSHESIGTKSSRGQISPSAFITAVSHKSQNPPKISVFNSASFSSASQQLTDQSPSSDIKPPLPIVAIPIVLVPAPEKFVFPESQNPLSRIVTQIPEIQAKTAFQATQSFQYNPSQSGPLQAILDKLEPYAFLKVSQGEYKINLHFQKPIYLQSEGSVTLIGSGDDYALTCDGEFIVIDGFSIIQDVSNSFGAISIKSGYASLLNCKITGSVQVCNSASADLFQCDLSGSVNPPLYVTNNAIVRCMSSKVHGSKTYGIVVDSKAALLITNGKVYENLISGVTTVNHSHLYVSQTEVSNNGSGFDLSSSGYLRIELSSIVNHSQGSGIIIRKQAAAVISETKIRGSGHSAIRSANGGVVQSSHNLYQDSNTGALLVAHTGGFILSEQDSFQGTATAAVVAFSEGKIDVRSMKLENFSGGAVLCYSKGKVVLTDVVFTRLSKFGIQIRDNSVLEATNVQVSQVPGPCLVLSQAHGFIRSSQFSGSSTIGAEILDVSTFEISQCEFNQNSIAGVLLRGKIGVNFSDCKFNSNGEIGADVNGKICAPIFNNCQFKTNLVGLRVTNFASPRLIKATVSDCQKVGVVLLNGSLTAETIDVSQCNEAAFGVFGQGKLVVTESTIHDNINFGCQSKSGTARFINTSFINHNSAGSLLAFNKAVIQCENCTFENAGQVHCEVRQKAIVHLENCDVGITSSGIGLQVRDDGILQLNGTKVHGNKKFGIMIGNGICKAANAVVTGCEVGGVYTQEGSDGQFQSCKIEKNGEIGVQVQGGTITMKDCRVIGHVYGIVVQSSAQFSEVSTKFEENTKQDLYYA